MWCRIRALFSLRQSQGAAFHDPSKVIGSVVTKLGPSANALFSSSQAARNRKGLSAFFRLSIDELRC
jgi:hypothetical protein